MNFLQLESTTTFLLLMCQFVLNLRLEEAQRCSAKHRFEPPGLEMSSP